MKIDLRAIGVHLANLAWVAVRTFFDTMFVLTLAGAILAGASYYFLREDNWAYGVLAAAVALTEAVVTGIFLGSKRAIALAAAHGLGALRIGRSLVRLVFERMLGIVDSQTKGERGGRIAQTLERIPLAKVESILNGAVVSLTGDAEGSWLRRKIQAYLLEAVRKYTLARFREEDAQHGGIDLLKVKHELEESVDNALVQKVVGGLWIWTLLMLLGLPLTVAAQTYILIALLR
ncbi:MAG TPA: hypothetical protein VFE62_28585 [Gemmataceae bacterium]|nr:hypothetical protein [Gemmataceae bacterium]